VVGTAENLLPLIFVIFAPRHRRKVTGFTPCVTLSQPAWVKVGFVEKWTQIFDPEALIPLLQQMGASVSQWPPAVTLGLALMLGALAGEVALRLRFSRVYGYWVAGAASAVALALAADTQTVQTAPVLRFAWVFDIALGWLLVEAGRRLDPQWLLRNPMLALSAALEWLLAALGVALVLAWFGVPWSHAMLAGVVLAHASPVLTHVLSLALRAEGQVAERAAHLSATGLVLTAAALPVALTVAKTHAQAAAASSGVAAPMSVVTMAQPLTDALIALGVGALLGALVHWISSPVRRHQPSISDPPPLSGFGGLGTGTSARSKALVPSPALRGAYSLQGPTLAGGVCLMVGLAQWWGLPALLGCIALGWAARTRSRSRDERGTSALSGVGALALVLVFMIAGASLPWALWVSQGVPQEIWLAALLLLAARLGGKLLAMALTGRLSGLRWTQSVALALALQPTSVTGVVFWLSAAAAFTAWNPLAVQAVAVALLLADLVMPALLAWLLRAAGEVAPTEPAESRTQPLNTQNSNRSHAIDTELLGAR
jgi:hypothetical protein